MAEGSILDKIALEFKELYEKYTEALENDDLDKAIEVGVAIMEDLLGAAENLVLPRITNPHVREITVNILGHHQKALAYVKGAKEAVERTPDTYAREAKERAADTLSAGINSLFGFILGALVTLVDLELTLAPSEGGYPPKDHSSVPRVV